MECVIIPQIVAGAKLYHVKINHPLYGWMDATDRPIPRRDAIETLERIKKWEIKPKQKKDCERLAG